MTKSGKLLFAIVFASVTAWSQQITANMRGTITDPSGAVVQNATVTARQLETGLTRTSTSDGAGNFLILELPLGHYRLAVTEQGIHNYQQRRIPRQVNVAAGVPF